MKDILPIPSNSEITILDILYYTEYKYRNDYKDDVLFILYKYNGQKRVKMIPRPEAEIYFTKPEFRNDWRLPREWVSLDKLDCRRVRYNKILSEVYKDIKTCDDQRSKDMLEFYNKAVENRNFSARKEIFKHQHTFMTDLKIEDYYNVQLEYNYNLNGTGTTKSFLDIEADVEGFTHTELSAGKNRVNAITVIFDYDATKKTNNTQVFTFLLRDYKAYPQQEYFETHLDKFISECHSEFDKFPIVRDDKEIILDNYADYHIKFYNKEEDLITSIFELINIYEPDLLGVWNIGYDLPKLRDRLEMLGKNHVDVMSHKCYPAEVRFVDMKIDNRPGIEMCNRKTSIKMTSKTKYIDQMQSYAGIRKGMKNYGGDGLDNISGIELGARKREFGTGITVHNAPRKAYWKFVLYNINDVWLQYILEKVTHDLDSLAIDSNASACTIENIAKQTIYLRNVYYIGYLKRNCVWGNNINNDYIGNITDEVIDIINEIKEASSSENEDDDEDEESLTETEEMAALAEDVLKDSVSRTYNLIGAIVGNPLAKTANGAELIRGVKSRHVFYKNEDMDFASMYPNIEDTRNICKSGQYGRLIIEDKISNRQNELNNPLYLPGGEFIKDYFADDVFSFANVWFGMRSVYDYIKEFKKWLR